MFVINHFPNLFLLGIFTGSLWLVSDPTESAYWLSLQSATFIHRKIVVSFATTCSEVPFICYPNIRNYFRNNYGFLLGSPVSDTKHTKTTRRVISNHESILSCERKSLLLLLCHNKLSFGQVHINSGVYISICISCLLLSASLICHGIGYAYIFGSTAVWSTM